MKHTLVIALVAALFTPVSSFAVSIEEDIATMLVLKGFNCGGNTVTTINSDTTDDSGNRTVNATCPNGETFTISVSSKGKIDVKQQKDD